MTEQAASDPPRVPDNSAELVEEAQPARELDARLLDPGFGVDLDPAAREFLEEYVGGLRRVAFSRRDIVSRLKWDCCLQPERMPWSEVSLDEADQFAEMQVRAVWPMVREGIVDQREMHILVRHGGCLEEEPEGVDVALIGPDDDDGVIVEFLPMTDVDAEEAEWHRRYTVMLVSSRARRERHPWRSLLRHCRSTSNAYGPTRFDLRLGRRPLQHWPRADRRAAGLVTKQPRCVEGIGPLGRYKVYNEGAYVGIELARGNGTLEGWIVWLDEDSVSVVLRWPFRGGCVCRTISESDENGRLVNDEGHLNGYGLQVVVDLLNDMYRAAVAMEERLSDIKRAMRTVYESISAERARIGPSVDARLRAIWRAVPGPRFNFDIAFFKSGLHAWGTENPGYFDNDVWWVHG